jgi:hypothetical protein
MSGVECGRREGGGNGGASEGVEGKEAGEVEVGAEEGKVGGEGVRGGMEDGGLLIGPAAGSKWEERERDVAR